MPFAVYCPFPDNPRLVSICGIFPNHANEEQGYEPLEELLWLLISLDKEEKSKPIILVIDSPGGDADAFDILLDHIRLISSPVYTVARNVDSAAALLFINGVRSHRYVFERSHITLHNVALCKCPECSKESFLKRFFKRSCRPGSEQEKLLSRTKEDLAHLLDVCTEGKILNRLGDWSDEHDEKERARAIIGLLDDEPIFNASEAIEYGLADHIITEKEFSELFVMQCKSEKSIKVLRKLNSGYRKRRKI